MQRAKNGKKWLLEELLAPNFQHEKKPALYLIPLHSFHDKVSQQSRQLTKAIAKPMRTFGSIWMESSITGKVLSVTKAKWGEERTIGGATIIFNQGKAFRKPKTTPTN